MKGIKTMVYPVLGVLLCNLCLTLARSLSKVMVPLNAKPGHIITQLPHINGQSYQLRDPLGGSISDLFTVMSQGQLITRADLTSLEGQSVFMYVEHQHPSNSWSQILHMDVLDDPEILQFEGQPYKGHIMENEPAGTIVQGLEMFQNSVKKFPYSSNLTLVSGDMEYFEIKSLPWSWNDIFLLNKKPLDREEKSCYHLVVKAEDIGSPEIFALITVYVDDDNDNKPEFKESVYSESISMDIDPLSTIMRLLAEDLDMDNVVSYLMDDNDIVYTLPDTGDVIVKDPTNLKEQSYEFDVFAVDQNGVKSAPASVRIEAVHPDSIGQDVASSRKRRAVDERVFVVNWDVTAGDLFSVADETSGPTSRYAIQDGASVPNLSIDPLTGSVFVVAGRQWNISQDEFTFTVNITKTDQPDFQQFLLVRIKMTDRGPFDPIFTNQPQPLTAMLLNWVRPYTLVAQLQAIDATEGAISQYKIESGAEGRFSIDPFTGDLITLGRLPFNCAEPFELAISAQTVGVPPSQSTPAQVLKVYCQELDPLFYQNPYDVTIDELMATDQVVLTVEAYSFFELPIKYKLTDESSPNSASEWFSIDENTGAIRPKMNLRYAFEPHQYRLVVTAQEQYSNKQSQVLAIINLRDINNYAPSFPLVMYMPEEPIPENAPIGTSVLEVSVIDLDSGEFGEVTFSINDPRFAVVPSLDKKSAQIQVAEPLDYDRLPGRMYEFMVTAEDGGGKIGESMIRVPISNINDETPVFTKADEQLVWIMQSATVGTVVHIIQVHDPDGDNIRLKFKGSSSLVNSKFRLNATSGELSITEALTEQEQMYYLPIVAEDDSSCCDGVGTRHYANVVIVIDFIGVNRAPYFTDCNSMAPAFMEEASGTAAGVAQIRATDPDPGSNGQMTFSIVVTRSKPTYFNIRPVPGEQGVAEIYPNITFNREKPEVNSYKIGSKYMYPVTVKVEDNGKRNLSATCFFLVHILDVNDHDPQFDTSQDYKAVIRDDTPVGARAVRVFAWDEDEGENARVTYSIQQGPICGGQACMSIDPTTGWISVATSIPNDMTTINLVVTATDNGSPARSQNVNVIITRTNDINLLPPRWNKVDGFEIDDYLGFVDSPIPENVAIGYKLPEKFSVTSLKPGNQSYWYYVVDNSLAPELNQEGIFQSSTVNINGNSMMEVVISNRLNFEETDHYILQLTASYLDDPTLFSEARLRVAIKDTNDQAPFFLGQTGNGVYPAYVTEGRQDSYPVHVTSVFAIDLDGTSPNNKVTYFFTDACINKGDCQYFDINADTGAITTMQEFTLCNGDDVCQGTTQKYFNLYIIAKDGDDSWLDSLRNSSSVQIVTITVNGASMNPPYFEESDYSVELPIGPYYNQTVAVVTAVSPDDGGELYPQYGITAGNNKRLFAVDSETGVIKAYGYPSQSQPEDSMEHTLRYRVFDGLKSKYTTVHVKFTDNAYPPVFDPVIYNVGQIQEEDPTISRNNPRLITSLVTATDPDKEGVSYSLSGSLYDPSLFFINEDGNTWMQQPLDRDFPGGYSNWQLNIVAEDLDGSNNQKFGYGILNLELIDINDNAPKFDSCCISGELGENENNVEVLTVKATDSDVGENARISYFLPPGGVPMKDGQPLFNIDSQGTIRNTLPLDREEIGEYTVVVSARDHGDPVRQTNQTVYITVTDKNDSPPEFAQNEYVVTIAENMAVGSSVLALTAADADSAENTLLTYVVEDGQDSQYFYMDSIYPAGVGVAKIDKVIDYDDNGIRELRFSVLVSDGVRPARTNVVVTITDANDNAPIITPQNSPTISLVENADPGQTVFTFNASDIDSGTNKQFYWGIDYENTDQFMNFAINENGEVRVRRRIDYEETPSLRVHVLAIDKGYPAMTGTATLNIEVINVNDNGPTLNMPPPGEYPYVGPNTNIGSQVAKIPIVDADGNDAKPYQLQACQITIGCNDFSFKLDDDRENLIVTANMDKTYSREALGFSFYTIPVVLVDSGSPRMTGTSTLIIYVENAQSQAVKPTDKELKVYNYNWNLHDVAIGSVATDFDIAGNTYELMGEHYGFELRNGPTLYILSEASPGRSALKVEVCRSQVCSISNIYVNVIAIDDNAVKSSGSMRLQGITAEAFITKSGQDSAMITLQMTLSEILDTAPENIEIFSVSNVPGQQNTIDVLYAAHGSPWYTPSRLNGRAMASKDMISQNLKLTALQVPIDDCSTTNCYDGGCTNKLVVNNGPAVVNGNTNTMAGVNANIVAMCTCGATYQEDITPNPQRCVNGSCLNGGTCRETFGDIQCDCPSGFEGPQCQQLRHSFSGDGWAWYDSLEVCYEDRLSFEIATIQRSSLLLYQGPIGSDVPPGEMPDFISIELIDGYPNLRLNLGDGEVEPGLQVTGFNSRGQKTMNSLDDGKWHMIEVIKSGMNISIIVDMCKDAEIIETLEATSEDRDACEARGVIPGQRFVLRDVSPLQIGGRQNPGTNYPTVLRKEGFNGCIRNLRHNGKLYDLHIGQKGEHENSADGCQREDAICQAKPCLGNSTCSAGISGSQTMCSCLPGFRGTNCETDTTSKDVETENSFMEWELDDSFNDTHVLEATEIQVMFRTRQTHGMIFSALSFSGLEHLKLSIAESHIEFAYDLGADEDTVSLPFLNVSDGEWHVANIQRQGSQVILKVDGGNGRYYNESGPFLGKHSLFSIFKEFVYGASDLEYKLYHPNPYPRNTLQSSCLNDFRYDDSWLPMIEDENRDSDTADLVKDVDMSEGCGAGTPCLAGSVCVAPLVCVNGWRLPVCMCPVGMIPHPTQVCVIRLDCYNNDCSGHGQCVNTGNGGSYCICDEGWFGDFCNQEALVGAMIATWQIIIIILAILLILLIAAFLAIAYRNKNNKQPLLDIDPDDDVRENVVFYNEEGAGEEDMLSYDITRLQKPMDDGDSMMKERRELVPYQTNAEPMAEPPFPQVGPDGKYPNIGDFIDDRLTDADDDPNSPPYDSVREYQYEGSGSTAGSLSSLNSSSSDGSQDYEYLNEWGPRFAKLAELYGGGAEDDEDASSV